MAEPGLSEALQIPLGPEDPEVAFDPPRQPLSERALDL